MDDLLPAELEALAQEWRKLVAGGEREEVLRCLVAGAAFEHQRRAMMFLIVPPISAKGGSAPSPLPAVLAGLAERRMADSDFQGFIARFLGVFINPAAMFGNWRDRIVEWATQYSHPSHVRRLLVAFGVSG